MEIKYGSVCSGIEAASVAWEPIGFKPVWFSEIEDFQSHVLKQHWPDIVNLGDMTKISAMILNEEIEAPDILVGGTPCFTENHLVLTSTGYVNIQDIKVGDLVVTHKGRLKKVLRIGNKKSNIGELSGVGILETINCTSNHPFLTYNDELEWGWEHAKNMSNRQWCSQTTFESFGDVIVPDERVNLKELMYIAGFYLGDGYIRRWKGKNKKAVMFGVNENKINKFKEKVRTNIYIQKDNKKIALHSTSIAEWLIDNFGEYSDKKELPYWVLSHPYRNELLQGYLDTDGSEKTNGWRANAVSRKLAYGIRELSQTLSYVSSVSMIQVQPTKVIEGRLVNQKNYWCISAFESSTSRKSRNIEDKLLRTCTGFTESDIETTVYNIEVEDDNSYIVQGIIVHNCQAFSINGARQGLTDPRGQLTLSYVELADSIDEVRKRNGKEPTIIVWENVPGVLTSKDNAFGCFLAGLTGASDELQPSGKKWSDAGYVLGEKRSIAWRILDSKYFGVPQQRRRVFVVASARTDICPAQILFEYQGDSWNFTPGSEAKQNNATGSSGCYGTTSQGQTTEINRFMSYGQYTKSTFSSTLKSKYEDGTNDLIVEHDQVRVYTPIECERLQGFPDDHTKISYKGQEVCKDTYRYKALGNSMAVPVMRWIGERINNEINGD